MSAPVIGITGRREPVGADVPPQLGHLRADTFITDYARSVARAGAVPVLLTREADPQDLPARLDGVVIAGGQDVDPRRYGSVPGPRSTALDPERDEFEIALVRAAIAAEIPLLGICRGAQVLNVALGGTLVDDLPAGAGEAHSFLGYPAGHRSHGVRVLPGTELRGVVGPELRVNSFHHQCVAELGVGLAVAAVAADGVIEAVELPGADVLGVQWHPEMLPGIDPLFLWLSDRSAQLDDQENDLAIA